MSIVRLFGSVVIFLAILFPDYVKAQTLMQNAGEGWSDPTLLFERPCTLPCTDEPRTVAGQVLVDRTDTAHLFWHSGDVIFHTTWVERSLTPSNDILIGIGSPFGAKVDDAGILHLVARSQDEGCLAYLQVPVQLASDPHIWSGSTCLDDIGVTPPDLTIDKTGVLHAVYVERGETGIAVVNSESKGRDWSAPLQVAYATNKEIYVGGPKIVTDEQGWLHVVWSELEAPDGYPPHRLLYSQSRDEGESWASPFELAGARQSEANIVTYRNTVHVVWNGDVSVQQRFYRYSSDNGVSWSERKTIPVPKGNAPGLQGPPAIAVDSTGVAHMLISEGRFLYYIAYDGNTWSSPELVAGPWNVKSDETLGELNHPSLAISSGNLLHAVYSRDLQAAYYQSRPIDAPYEQSTVQAYPLGYNSIADSTVLSSPTLDSLEVTAIPAQSSSSQADVDAIVQHNSPMRALLVGILPSILLLVVILANTIMRRQKHGGSSLTT